MGPFARGKGPGERRSTTSRRPTRSRQERVEMTTAARRAVLGVWLGLLAAGIAIAPDADAQGRGIAAIEKIDRPGLRRAMFVLREPARLEILSVGAGDRNAEQFLAQGWILDLESRTPVWIQEEA